MSKRKSLQKKLVFSIVSIIVIFGVLATAFVYWEVKRGVYEYTKQDYGVIATLQSRHTNNLLDSGKRLVVTASEQKLLISYLSENSKEIQNPDVLELLKQYNLGDIFSAIYLMNTNGVVLVSTDPTFLSNDYSFRDYFTSAKTGNSFVDVSLGATSDKLGYYFSNPIKSLNGEIVGVLVAKMIPEYVDSTVKNINIEHELHIKLLDRYGVVVSSSEDEDTYKSIGKLSDGDYSEIMSSNRYPGIAIEEMQYDEIQNELSNIISNASFEITDQVDNAEEIINVAKVGDYPFYVFLEHNVSIFKQQATKTALLLGVIVFTIAFLSIVIVYRLVSRFLRPLEKLKEMSEKISKGNFDVDFNLKTGDEIEDLGNSFNAMKERVMISYANFEERVLEKTKDLQNQQKALLNVLEDVEEEKGKSDNLAQDLKKFQLAVENASDHIVITDPDGIILFANKAVEKITGYRIKDIIGKKAGNNELWGGKMDEKYYIKMWETIKKKKKVFTGEITNIRKNKDEYIALVNIAPILNKEGDVIFFVGIERDITKEKEIDRAKTEFVSLASHQLRTPLSTINWYSEMLLDGDVGKLNKGQQNYLKEVYKGNQRMVGLVNSLLNVSRLELGTFAIDPEKTKIVDIIKSVINEIMPQLNKKKQIFAKSLDNKIPFMMLDIKLIRMVIQNLLSNAIKYTPEKGKIGIVLKQDKKKKIVQIIVSDSGMGITQSQQDKIFTKLFRADNVKESDTEGTGLGLYIVKSIVEHSGGKVWFESVENVGSTFYVNLPLRGMQKKEGTKELS
ncbi:MAG: ATP-binding protein [Patescibacteria group bacterium]|jgi:PAS domain S-box-containing protein